MEGLVVPKLFIPEVINKVIDSNRPGVYVLGNNKGKFNYTYVGRSDTCIKTRLLSHNYLYVYEYFIFKYTRSSKEAFYLECQWWHDCNDNKLVNKIHPASPKGSRLQCPYCHFARYLKLAKVV